MYSQNCINMRYNSRSSGVVWYCSYFIVPYSQFFIKNPIFIIFSYYILMKYGKIFVGAGDGTTRPYKWFSNFCCNIIKSVKYTKPCLKNMNFSPLEYDNLYIWTKIANIQFFDLRVRKCPKHKGALK